MGSNQKESWKDEYQTYTILEHKICKLRNRISVLNSRLDMYLKQREEMKKGYYKYKKKVYPKAHKK